MATRYQPIEREHFDADGQAIYDAIVKPRGFMPTPHAILMQNPPIAGLMGALGAHLRYQGSLPDDVRELAILTVGRLTGARYEWVQHEPIARRVGVSDAAIDTVLRQAPTTALPERDRIVIDTARALLNERALTDAQFAAAQSLLGVGGLPEFIVLVGAYHTLATVLLAYQAPIPADMTAPF